MPYGSARRLATIAFASVLGMSAALSAQEGNAETLVLGVSSYWRCHYTLKPPVVRKAGALEKIVCESRGTPRGRWLQFDTPLPPKDWMQPEFNDVGWHRMWAADPDSPWVALLCMRGKFTVKDPRRAKGLKLSTSYRGGIAVYLNGKEIARGHLKKNAPPDDLAEDYPAGNLKG
ncbi:MAG: hypothetical protein AMS16_06320, partial [Planctomycetes bacterium DG_58]